MIIKSFGNTISLAFNFVFFLGKNLNIFLHYHELKTYQYNKECERTKKLRLCRLKLHYYPYSIALFTKQEKKTP